MPLVSDLPPLVDPALLTLSLPALLLPFFTRIRRRNRSDEGTRGGWGWTTCSSSEKPS